MKKAAPIMPAERFVRASGISDILLALTSLSVRTRAAAIPPAIPFPVCGTDDAEVALGAEITGFPFPAPGVAGAAAVLCVVVVTELFTAGAALAPGAVVTVVEAVFPAAGLVPELTGGVGAAVVVVLLSGSCEEQEMAVSAAQASKALTVLLVRKVMSPELRLA